MKAVLVSMHNTNPPHIPRRICKAQVKRHPLCAGCPLLWSIAEVERQEHRRAWGHLPSAACSQPHSVLWTPESTPRNSIMFSSLNDPFPGSTLRLLRKWDLTWILKVDATMPAFGSIQTRVCYFTLTLGSNFSANKIGMTVPNYLRTVWMSPLPRLSGNEVINELASHFTTGWCVSIALESLKTFSNNLAHLPKVSQPAGRLSFSLTHLPVFSLFVPFSSPCFAVIIDVVFETASLGTLAGLLCPM